MAETDDRSAFEGIRSATILKPGDRVLVELGDGCDRATLDEIADGMKARFPDVSFTFISGALSITVEAVDHA